MTLTSLCCRAFPNLLGRRALGSLLCRLLHKLLSLGLVVTLGTACGTSLYLIWRRFLGHCFTFSSLLHNFLLRSLSLLFHHLNLLLGLLGLLSSNLGNLVGTGTLPFFSSQDKCLRLQSSSEGSAQVSPTFLAINVRILGQQVLGNGRPGGALLVPNLNDGILDHLQVGRVGCSSFPRIGSISSTHLCRFLLRSVIKLGKL